jgi:molybdopterin/thiamine biosynthesis adenylyltransferase
VSDRYSRQTVLPEVGSAGQARLRGASVLVVGAGGLGCAVLPYLCAAGIGRLIVMDDDRVEQSNLHRQPLYRMSDCGRLKVDSARAALLALNPDVRVDVITERLTPLNADHVVQGADLVVDAADSFAVTYTLSDECYSAGKTLISASVLGLTGYVGVFCGGSPSYRAVFPDLPHQAGSCAEAGVLGTVVAVLGALQAHLVLAMLLQLWPSPQGQMTTVDLRTLHFGGFSFARAFEPANALSFIAHQVVTEEDSVIDLRSLHEAPCSPFAQAMRLSVEQIEREPPALPIDRRIVLCCRSGLRAWRAARLLQAQGYRRLALIAIGH